jgi:hypothetical protein
MKSAKGLEDCIRKNQKRDETQGRRNKGGTRTATGSSETSGDVGVVNPIMKMDR